MSNFSVILRLSRSAAPKMTSRSPQRPLLDAVNNDDGNTTRSDTKSLGYMPKCTTDEYIKVIADHSQQSSAATIYPGEIYDTLKRFLEQKPNILSRNAGPTASDFAWLISPSQRSQQDLSEENLLSDSNKNQRRFDGFADPRLCIEALRNNIELSQPQVLFLRGHPSPDWLSSIGAFCFVDPELFRWFLRYREDAGSDYNVDSAPSVMSNIFRFKIFTIGSKKHRDQSSQEEVNSLRRKAASDFRIYQNQLRGNWDLKTGDSIVRNFHVLDERHCIIEQEVVISLFDVGKTWMAIACSDAGHDFAHGPRPPWPRVGVEPLPMELLPIFQYRSRCALRSRRINDSTTGQRKERNPQSLAIFPEGYGHSLDWSLAKRDRFHVLSDIFRLAAFSQKQLLTVMRKKIVTETNHLTLDNEEPTLANLLYFRDILHDQLSNTSYMLQLTNNQKPIFQSTHRSLHNKTNDSRNAADHTMSEINSLFHDLHLEAQSLHDKCTHGMTVISNNSMLAESQRAIQQARQVTKLTLVAFVYLPFTFTAGFFGMNFKELGNGTLHLWIFFAASFPLMFFTMAFFAIDLRTAKRILRAVYIAHWNRPAELESDKDVSESLPRK